VQIVCRKYYIFGALPFCISTNNMEIMDFLKICIKPAKIFVTFEESNGKG
jgi:hypothetical protein